MTSQREAVESRSDFPVFQARQPMAELKVLIPYDGSERSISAFRDLTRAGLPAYLDAFVAVTNVWLPMSPYEITRAVTARRMKALTAGVSSFVPALRDYEEQRVLSLEAERRIRSIFPQASVKTEAVSDVAGVTNEILQKAEKWQADLIVVGANASPSHHITDYAGPAIRLARHAHCSVRIARAFDRAVESPVRIILAVDGSGHSKQVIRSIANRRWLSGSQVRLIALPKSGPRRIDKNSETTLNLTKFTEALRAATLEVSTAVVEGEPHEVLLHEARKFSADCIFVHARGLGNQLNDQSNEPALDDVTQAVALGAHCSVEVVREHDSYDIDRKPAA